MVKQLLNGIEFQCYRYDGLSLDLFAYAVGWLVIIVSVSFTITFIVFMFNQR